MHKQSFSKIQDRAETLIQKLESKAASADVKYHANAWKEVARGQNMRAWGWLLAAIAFGLGLAAFISLGFEGLTDSSWPQIVTPAHRDLAPPFGGIPVHAYAHNSDAQSNHC